LRFEEEVGKGQKAAIYSKTHIYFKKHPAFRQANHKSQITNTCPDGRRGIPKTKSQCSKAIELRVNAYYFGMFRI